MIVRKRLNALALLFALQGSVLPRIFPQVLCAGLFGLVVAAVHSSHFANVAQYTTSPFTLLGIALSLFLGFRNNAAYDRWWEARKQWGRMVFEVRSLARASEALLGATHPERRQLLAWVSAFAHALKGNLREQDVRDALTAVLGAARAARALAAQNPADRCLREAGRSLGRCLAAGRIDSQGLRILDERLTGLAEVQAASERIRRTPLPFAYTLLVHRTAYLYCYLLPFGLVGSMGWFTPVFTAIVAYTFFGLDALAEELEQPFGETANALSLDAICRSVDISIAEALDEPVPAPLAPVDHVLL
ncbi:bestrophin family protein [Denitromonas iodatirespirans]|uniref:Bestrophin n=1 Tax=Denitromonas iodatirespirans TaxID=2795389 RepID=A0A944D8R1_DENI1|nr:bestrophin family ion channel [Denitromonas iodatirespirans]MBT0960426.1 bestrophin [Denitromonas iodatirespirans]